jgi:hypothetical protein
VHIQALLYCMHGCIVAPRIKARQSEDSRKAILCHILLPCGYSYGFTGRGDSYISSGRRSDAMTIGTGVVVN